MKAKIHITLKTGVLDPQGRAIVGALHNMGFPQVDDVRQGKYIEVDVKESDRKKCARHCWRTQWWRITNLS